MGGYSRFFDASRAFNFWQPMRLLYYVLLRGEGCLLGSFLGEGSVGCFFNVEALFHGEGQEEFVKSSRVVSRAFIAQRCTNRHGRYLALAKYKGGGRRGCIIISEGSEGEGLEKLLS